jgi:hypothetical protein
MKDELDNTESVDPCFWMQHGDPAKAVILSRIRHERDDSPSSHLQLGIALLWIGDYISAAQHFQDRIEQRPRMRSENDYMYLGAAQWCVDDTKSAERSWKAAIKAPYAVGGVCARSPLLLILTSILRPGLTDRAKAEHMLLEKGKDPRCGHWPGTLSQWVAGLIDDAGLEASQETHQPHLPMRPAGRPSDRLWLSTFYKRMLELRDNESRSEELARVLKSVSDPSAYALQTSREFYYLTRHPEFYLVRHETHRYQTAR